MTQETKLTTLNLKQFTGSEDWYRHGLDRNVTFTDGAKLVADEGGAYWLLDTIAVCQRYEPKSQPKASSSGNSRSKLTVQ